jgi:hypothetical protein
MPIDKQYWKGSKPYFAAVFTLSRQSVIEYSSYAVNRIITR